MPAAELMQYPDQRGLRIDVACEFRDKEIIKLVPGAKWDSAAHTWYTPISWASCVQLRGVFGADLVVGAALTAWSQNELATRIQPCLALRTAADATGLEFFSHLKPYQRAGVAFLAMSRQALCADEMGLGKTVQAIATMELLGADAFPALIVSPNSMKLTWAAEFARWAPGRRVQVIQGTKPKRVAQMEAIAAGDFDVGIINFESLRQHTRLASYGSMTMTDEEKTPKELNAIPWRTVIADEAHRAKDPKTKQTRALWWMGDHAEYRYALTGTPVANSPEDAWAMMRFVSPLEFPAKTKFIERYAMQSWNVFGFMEVVGIRPEAQAELFKIIDPRMIRRLKASVLQELPPITYSTRIVQMEPKQKAAYEAMRKESMVQLDTGILIASNPLPKLTRLRQFASAYGSLSYETVACPECDGTGVAGGAICGRCQGACTIQKEILTLTEPSCKVDALEEVIEELGESQAVIWAESAQLINLAYGRLARGGKSVGLVTGAQTAAERQAWIDAFQRGDTKLLLCTFAAASEGITLTAASVAIFLQRTFNFIQNQQAEARIHRIGQEASNVTVIDLVTENTIEPRVAEALRTKGDQLEEFVRDVATLKEWLSK